MILLVKYPSRERPMELFRILTATIDLSTDPTTRYLISLDENDPKLKQYLDLEVLKHPQVKVVVGKSNNKIHAVNRDLLEYNYHWDIVLVLSDDQHPQKKGWDSIIIAEMEERFPDTDGSLWFHDGYQRRINTQEIVGRKFYDRFKYIYCDEYISLWSDNEQTEKAEILKKQAKFVECIFKHEHYSNNNKVKKDALMKKTDTRELYEIDKRTFDKRKRNNFGL